MALLSLKCLRILATTGAELLDFCFPPRCRLCEKSLKFEEMKICNHCLGSLRYILPSYCEICGIPFPDKDQPKMKCGDCAVKKPHYLAARSLIVYDEKSRPVIRKIKEKGEVDLLAPLLKSAFARHEPVQAYSIDMIIPVPMHRKDYFRRGYDQTFHLARHLAIEMSLPLQIGVLYKTRRIDRQSSLDRENRRNNVRGAFAIAISPPGSIFRLLSPNRSEMTKEQYRIICDRQTSLLKAGKKPLLGMSVILVDDIITSGSTIEECSRVLRREGGAKTVIALSLARRLSQSG